MPLLIGLNVDRQMQVFADVFLLKIYGMYLFYCIIISVKIMFDCTGILCLSLKQCCGAGADIFFWSRSRKKYLKRRASVLSLLLYGNYEIMCEHIIGTTAALS